MLVDAIVDRFNQQRDGSWIVRVDWSTSHAKARGTIAPDRLRGGLDAPGRARRDAAGNRALARRCSVGSRPVTEQAAAGRGKGDGSPQRGQRCVSPQTT
jgi:hypothetical protein